MTKIEPRIATQADFFRVLTRPAAESGSGPRSHISARTRKGIELIPLDQVVYFIADHKYVTLRHEAGEVLLDEPLKALEDEFGERFVRIHRNALVASRAIRALEKHMDSEEGEGWAVRLHGVDELLAVSRRQLAAVRDLISG